MDIQDLLLFDPKSTHKGSEVTRDQCQRSPSWYELSDVSSYHNRFGHEPSLTNLPSPAPTASSDEGPTSYADDRIVAGSGTQKPKATVQQHLPPRHIGSCGRAVPVEGKNLNLTLQSNDAKLRSSEHLGNEVYQRPKRRKKNGCTSQKWDRNEDAKVIELRGLGMKWVDISRELPGRTDIACRLHYQNYLEKTGRWDEESKTKLSRAYEKMKSDLWQPLARELGVPWRSAEAMHWTLGEREMTRRACTSPNLLLDPAQGFGQSFHVGASTVQELSTSDGAGEGARSLHTG